MHFVSERDGGLGNGGEIDSEFIWLIFRHSLKKGAIRTYGLQLWEVVYPDSLLRLFLVSTSSQGNDTTYYTWATIKVTTVVNQGNFATYLGSFGFTVFKYSADSFYYRSI